MLILKQKIHQITFPQMFFFWIIIVLLHEQIALIKALFQSLFYCVNERGNKINLM